MMRVGLRSLIALAIAAGLPPRAEACMCMTSPSTSEAFAEAHAVVVADVLEESQAAGHLDRIGMWLRGFWARRANRKDVDTFAFEWQIHVGQGRALRLQVVESFKGLPAGRVTIFTASRETSCGWGIDTSVRYLIYIRVLRDPDAPAHPYLITGDCMRTAPLDSTKDEIDVLRGLAARKK